MTQAWQIQAIRRRVINRNLDYICCFVGRKGSGKSYSALTLCGKVDPTFNENRIVFDAESFVKLIKSPLEKGSAVLFDEVGVERLI